MSFMVSATTFLALGVRAIEKLLMGGRLTETR
jgi:hypothetical protein